MKEIFRKIKAFYIQKKKLAVGVTVAVLGVLAAVGVYAMMPEVKAAPGDTESEPLTLTSGINSVEGGKWYKITGGFTDTYTLQYTGDGTPVNLILEGINWMIGQDKPAIEFTGVDTQRGDIQNDIYTSSSSSRANFNVIISGRNTITSTCAAKNPLISAESITYKVKTYGYMLNWGQNNYLEADVVRDCDVVFKGNNNSADDVLILTTGAGSTGAAIGSADVSMLDDKIVLDNDTRAEVSNTYTSTENRDATEAGILYKYHQEVISGNVKYGVGNIEITHGANIIIDGRGDGAGIGTGASSEENVTYKRSLYDNPRGQITAKNMLDGNNVEILGGSVSVHMADNAAGCCIGVGAVAGNPVKQGSVQIKGGNVDLVPGRGYEFGEARNGNTLVYKFRLDLSTPPFSSSNSYQLEDIEGERFDVFADYTGEENANRDGKLHFTVSAAIANAGMSGDRISDYEFEGYAKAYFDRRSSTDMYFYLPTKTLTPYKLTITGDSPEVKYSYSIGAGAEQTYSGPVSVKETKNVTIKPSNVSKYCKSITYTVSSRSGTSTQTITVDQNWDGTISFTMPSNDCTVSFQYEIPKYTIRYDYGAGRQYENSIRNDNAGECSFGIDYELKDITWDNHIFMGWYLDSSCEGEPISEIKTPSEDYIQSGYSITVYAKWGCTVSFVDENGNLLTNLKDENGNEFTNPLTLEMNPNAVLYSWDYPQDLEDTSLRAFDGWIIDGELYEKPEEGDEYPQKTINGNTVIQAKFHEIGYYVYIYTEYMEPNFGNIINVEPSQVGNFATYYHYISGGENQPIEFEKYDTEDGKVYYRTKEFISGEDIGQCLVTCSIKAKKGYSIAESGIHAYNARTNEEIELGKGEKDEQAYQFTMPDSDVYIKVSFEEGNYEVVYYDVNEDDEVIPAILDEAYGEPVTDYNARSKEFKLVPAKQTDKYKRFVGWCKIGETEVIKDNLVIPQDHLENLYLYAKWEDVVTYPIIVSEEAAEYITVYDTDRNLPVDKGIPGEKLKIVVDVPRGVRYNSMTWYYTDINNSDCTLVHTPAADEKSPYIYDFIMPPASPVRIEGEFSWIEYHITYLNLNGAVNPNPITYTVKDKIDLEALEKKGIDFKGWNIVLPDEDNYIGDEHFATKEEPIETINGDEMSGNLILVAHWDPENEIGNTLYKILIEDGLLHGTMDSFATEAYGGQYVFFSAIPDRGYRLKNVSYNDTEPQIYSAQKALRAIEGILNAEFDIPLYEVADGIYYFIMPDHDVNLVAEFEPIEYTITYVDGSTEDNPTVYTVEDEIWLTAPSKDGFEFLGWYDEEDNLVSSIADSTGNLILTAKWKDLNLEPVTPPDEPGTPATPDTPDNQEPNPPSNQQQGGNTNSNSNSSIDKLLAWINNSSKVDSSEDKAASNNQNKGNITQQLSTGDQANIGHFALLCVMSLIIIILACPKKEEEETEQNI